VRFARLGCGTTVRIEATVQTEGTGPIAGIVRIEAIVPTEGPIGVTAAIGVSGPRLWN
jgi:hypothetical protein